MAPKTNTGIDPQDLSWKKSHHMGESRPSAIGGGSNFYSNVESSRIPKGGGERDKELKKRMSSLGPFGVIGIPSLAIVKASNKLSDALGGRKNLVYRPGSPSKRETGK